MSPAGFWQHKMQVDTKTVDSCVTCRNPRSSDRCRYGNHGAGHLWTLTKTADSCLTCRTLGSKKCRWSPRHQTAVSPAGLLAARNAGGHQDGGQLSHLPEPSQLLMQRWKPRPRRRNLCRVTCGLCPDRVEPSDVREHLRSVDTCGTPSIERGIKKKTPQI